MGMAGGLSPSGIKYRKVYLCLVVVLASSDIGFDYKSIDYLSDIYTNVHRINGVFVR